MHIYTIAMLMEETDGYHMEAPGKDTVGKHSFFIVEVHEGVPGKSQNFRL